MGELKTRSIVSRLRAPFLPELRTLDEVTELLAGAGRPVRRDRVAFEDDKGAVASIMGESGCVGSSYLADGSLLGESIT